MSARYVVYNLARNRESNRRVREGVDARVRTLSVRVELEPPVYAPP